MFWILSFVCLCSCKKERLNSEIQFPKNKLHENKFIQLIVTPTFLYLSIHLSICLSMFVYSSIHPSNIGITIQSILYYHRTYNQCISSAINSLKISLDSKDIVLTLVAVYWSSVSSHNFAIKRRGCYMSSKQSILFAKVVYIMICCKV